MQPPMNADNSQTTGQAIHATLFIGVYRRQSAVNLDLFLI